MPYDGVTGRYKPSSPVETGVAAYFALIIATGITLAALAAFKPSVYKENKSGGTKNASKNSEEEKAFAISSSQFRDAYEMLEDINSTDSWTGDSKSQHEARALEFRALTRQVAEINNEVDATAQTQAQQVSDGRKTLENIFDELQLAIPVAESLYFSGPAGPALSYNFQLAVANPAISTSTDTASTMHDNATQHAERLRALAQQYDDTRQSVPDMGLPTGRV